MKHPLTSKERRGLVAVAAAALFCIGAGFAFRGCSGQRASGSDVIVVDNDSVAAESRNSTGLMDGTSAEKTRPTKDYDGKKQTGNKGSKSKTSRKKSSGKKSSKRAEKTYPDRSPLDEPIGSH